MRRACLAALVAAAPVASTSAGWTGFAINEATAGDKTIVDLYVTFTTTGDVLSRIKNATVTFEPC